MAAAKQQSSETAFLREFARSYVSDISFTREALADIRTCGVGLADVLHVLRKGRVTTGEKESADGARWLVEGITCHGERMTVSLHVWCDRYCVRVLRIF